MPRAEQRDYPFPQHCREAHDQIGGTTLLEHSLLNSINRCGFIIFILIHPILHIGECSMLGVELTQKVVQVGLGLAYSLWRALAEKRFLYQGRIFKSITIFEEIFFLLAACQGFSALSA